MKDAFDWMMQKSTKCYEYENSWRDQVGRYKITYLIIAWEDPISWSSWRIDRGSSNASRTKVFYAFTNPNIWFGAAFNAFEWLWKINTQIQLK